MKEEPEVTIISAVYGATDEFLKKMSRLVKGQEYSGKINHIFINDNARRPRNIEGLNIINNEKNLGVTSLLNMGFKMAKTEIVVSLLDDCLPSSKNWLKTLIKPLTEDQSIAATVSLVELPYKFWSKFDFFAKAMTEKEQKVLSPGIDAKGCAYRVSALKEFDYLDNKYFFHGGEDANFTLKIKESKKWTYVLTDAKVYHLHYTNTKSRIKKEKQYAQLAALIARKQFFRETWNYKLSVFLKEFSFLLFVVSLFSLNIKFITGSFAFAFVVANLRLPFQIKKLWKNPLILIVPFFNLFLYIMYFFAFTWTFLMKPKV